MTNQQKKFIIDGNNARIIHLDPDYIQNSLPPAVYSLKFNELSGFSLTKKLDYFDIPEKLFGDIEEKVSRLMHRYNLNGEISALLSGEKGSGKTLLAHVFSNKAIEQGKSVILVDSTFDNVSGLKNFLCEIGNNVFIFDEFAKNFSKEEQNQMLDFFSGSNYSKRATFIIENRESSINEFMLDRPGRIRFHFRYDKLPLKTITEVCKYNNLPTETTRNILNYAIRSLTIGMDTLNKLIEECKIDNIQTKEEFKDLVNILNISTTYDIKYVCTGIIFQDKVFSSSGFDFTVRRRDLHGDLDASDYKTNKLIKEVELFVEQNPESKFAKELQPFANEDYDPNDKDNDHKYEWWNFYLDCGLPSFNVDGVSTFICRKSGLQFIVEQEKDQELGDIEHLLS